MGRRIRQLAMVLLVTCVTGITRAATVAIREAEPVAGALLGFLVQRTALEYEQGEPPLVKATYEILSGKDVERIDAEGLHLRKGASNLVLVASQPESPPYHNEVMSAAARHLLADSAKSFTAELPRGGRVTGLGMHPAKPRSWLDELLGELVFVKGEGQILAALRVETPNGVETIDLERVVSGFPGTRRFDPRLSKPKKLPPCLDAVATSGEDGLVILGAVIDRAGFVRGAKQLKFDDSDDGWLSPDQVHSSWDRRRDVSPPLTASDALVDYAKDALRRCRFEPARDHETGEAALAYQYFSFRFSHRRVTVTELGVASIGE